MNIDFEDISRRLLASSGEVLRELFPNGKQVGREYHVGDLAGNQGASLKINSETGVWADFAEGVTGGNLIVLYAKAKGIRNGEAAKELCERFGLPWNDDHHRYIKPQEVCGEIPPDDWGSPPPEEDGRWCYTDADGKVLFWVCRVNGKEGKKRFVQWSWSSKEKGWTRRGWPSPRPLYNLRNIVTNPEKRLLWVEGEKCVDAAQAFLGDRCVVFTSCGGTGGIGHADWGPLAGRDVTIWPDADKMLQGKRAALGVGRALGGLGCKVTMLDISGITRDKWDIADAIDDGWTVDQMVEWTSEHARPLVEDIVPVKPTEAKPTGMVCPTLTSSPVWAALGLTVNKQGEPVNTMDNVAKALGMMEDGAPDIWFDDFKQRYVIKDGDEYRPMVDSDVRRICRVFQGKLGMVTMGMPAVWDGVYAYGDERHKNSAHEFIEHEEWDKTPRVRDFLTKVCGAEDSEYTRQVSQNFFISIVSRAYAPGQKVDNMIILEGEQGIKKNMMLNKLLGPLFGEINQPRFDPREFCMAMQGHLVVEMGELHAFKTADVEQLKSFITTQVDVIREPYARLSKSYPRQTIFIGTTNLDEYLTDITGARRFWPIRCGKISPEIAEMTRHQLFAEAKVLYDGGATWWEVPQEAADDAVEARRHNDAWEQVIADNAQRLGSEMHINEILLQLFEMEPQRIEVKHQMRMARALKKNGWKKTRKWANGGPKVLWVSPGSQVDIF